MSRPCRTPDCENRIVTLDRDHCIHCQQSGADLALVGGQWRLDPTTRVQRFQESA